MEDKQSELGEITTCVACSGTTVKPTYRPSSLESDIGLPQ